jgi:AraC-like DNA-binding protein
MAECDFVAPVRESSRMVRHLLAASEAGGADARRLAKQAQIPGWILASDDAMISPDYALRLWELAEHALDDPQLALTFADRYQPGELDLYDYLFSTAATLRDGLSISGKYLHLLTTNARLQVESETDREVTYSYRYLVADGRGADLALQLSVAIFCARARAGTGQPIVPVRLTFRQRAPRSHRAFGEAFGTDRVDFDAPVTTFTFRTRDVDLPMLGADPALARILARYAAMLPPPPDPTWREHFRLLLAEALDDGNLSLSAMARRMTVSPRTLQRHLAGHGTTWRFELDAARRWRADQLRDSDPIRLAHHLGYSHPRSVNRAVQRWATDDDDPPPDSSPPDDPRHDWPPQGC